MSKKAIKYGASVSNKAVSSVLHTDVSSGLVWSFRRLDMMHERWSLRNKERLSENLVEKMSALERMTLQEIISASGGRSHGTNSHWENIFDLCSEAQKRWVEIGLEEYDRVLSLRLQGKHRLYGVLDGNVFLIVWYDTQHEIYTVKG